VNRNADWNNPGIPRFCIWTNEKGKSRMEENKKVKRAYETPEAKNVSFNYEENIVASATKPPEDPAWWWCSTCRPDLF